MTSPKEYSPDALRVLLLGHLDGSLSVNQEKEVMDLLRTSAHACRELEELRKMVDALKTDKTLFCPDLSEIYQFVTSGTDPVGDIARHLTECPSCRKEVSAFEAFQPAERMPAEIWQIVSRSLSQRARKRPSIESPEHLPGFFERIVNLFRMPVLTFGTAAAVAVLLVVFLYPRRDVGPTIALSSVSWQTDFTTKIPISPIGRERVALLIVLKDFKPPMSQSTIDSLYEALKPDDRQQKRYDLVAPSRVKAALGEVTRGVSPIRDSASVIRTKIGVDRVVVVTVAREEKNVRLTCESVDPGTGELVGQESEAVAPEKNLEVALRKVVYDSLEKNLRKPVAP